MAQPVWVTPAGDLGTIAEGLYFQIPIVATDPDGGSPTYSLIAGRLPEGVQVSSTGTIDGVPVAYTRVAGVPTEVSENVTSSFAIRATSPDGATINDRTFSITITGQDIPTFTTPAGSLGTFYDCDNVNITIGFTDVDPNDIVIIDVDNGELPAGLTINPSTGLISGHISPISDLPDDAASGFDASAYDLYPFDFSQRSINKTYEFTLRISDGKDQNLRTFSMFVISRDSLTADTTDFTADSMVLTADLSPQRTPYITNYPSAIVGPPAVAAGTIGTFRHDNFFAYQIIGFDCDGDTFEFAIVTGDSTDLPPGITFDKNTGWLSGFFPDQGATENLYSFSIIIQKVGSPEVQSTPYAYNISVIGSIENAVSWSVGTLIPGTELAPVYSLGVIDNGAISTFAIKATNPTGRLLQFKLKTGSYPSTPGQYNLLPQGLELLSSGNISGRVSFNTFTFDGGTTTFDKDVTTRLISAETVFDKNFDFTVIAYSSDGLVSVSRTFRIVVDRTYSSPYNGIYIKAMPDQTDRSFVNSLVQNTDVIDPERIYRNDDPYFGIASSVIYNHAYSLDTATLEEYVNALTKNHFRKKLILGEIKTAQALNADGTVEYEVVYSEVVDTGVNKLGESPPQSLTLPYPASVYGARVQQAIVEVQEPQVYDNRFHKLEAGEIHTIADATFLGEFPPWETPKKALAVKAAEDPVWHQVAKDMSLLTTVASQMSARWNKDEMPSNPAGNKVNDPFNWTPENKCIYCKNPAEELRFLEFFPNNEYDNSKIIWCEYLLGEYGKKDIPKDNPYGYKPGDPKYHVAPYAVFVEPAGEDYCYVTVRGTLNGPDTGLDGQANLVKSPFGNGTGLVAQGFNKAFLGLGTGLEDRPNVLRPYSIPGQSLIEALNNTSRTKIRIGGHSLGGSVATSVAALAATLNKFDTIESYPTAGPQMGNIKFYQWFQTLKTTTGVSVNDNFTRIINRNITGEWNDIVPKLPGYQPVGIAIYFNARYLGQFGLFGDVGRNHQICGAYAYAIRFPDAPYNEANAYPNPAFNFPDTASYGFDLPSHLQKLHVRFNDLRNGYRNVSLNTETVTTVYPNSLINMRDRIVDTIGQTNSILPQWMTTKQTDGRVLGFTKAWVICYTKPGESDRISYNIRTQFGEILNRVDFISDRYILDNQLTATWVPNEDSTDGGNWNPSPPLTTTFNANQTTNPTSSGKETTFDGNSLRFTSPVDVYGKTDKYDKYLVFPTNTILGSADSSTTITHVSSGNVTIDQNLEDYEGPYFVFGTSDSGFTDGKKGYYYPLYLVRSDADAADNSSGSIRLGNGKSHIHTFEGFSGINFYMPNSSTTHGVGIQPENIPEYTYSGNLGPIATVGVDTTPNLPDSGSGYLGGGGSSGDGGSSGGGGGGYGSSSSSSSASYSGY